MAARREAEEIFEVRWLDQHDKHDITRVCVGGAVLWRLGSGHLHKAMALLYAPKGAVRSCCYWACCWRRVCQACHFNDLHVTGVNGKAEARQQLGFTA
jgi:hypothetical protein